MDFIIVLIGHWVGDYLVQTRNMAIKKSSSIKWLLIHVFTYTAVLFVVAQFLFSWQVGLGYTLFNGALHLIVDFFTSKLTTKYQDRSHIFYPILGFDQLLHTICLYWTFINSDVLAL